MNLGNRISVQRLWVKGSTDGGNSADSTFIDMSGWDSAYILLTQGATEQTTGASVKVRCSSDASTGGAYVKEYTSAVRWDSSGQSALGFDCKRILKRYLSVKASMTSGLLQGWAFKYSGRRQGSTQAVLAKTMRRQFVFAMTS